MTPLRATCRIQLRGGIGFDAILAALPGLRRLGISHLYLSPVFTARTGSTHGYDVTRPDRIDPALGGREGFERLARAAVAAGMGILLDIVPNHMAASVENPWWADVLEHGPGSRFAGWFDIDWQRPGCDGRVVLPVLSCPRHEALRRGRLRLGAGGEGVPVLLCEGQPLPLRPETRAALAGADLERLNRDPAGTLEEVVREQHYRPVYWRAGADWLNWRRFFDIHELVGLRIEDDEVFAAVHGLVLELVRDGLVHGLRIDHIDGLADPAAYLGRLRAALAGAGAGTDFPVWVEKILGRDEELRDDWPVDGTTGYEALNDLSSLLCDGRGMPRLERFYARLAGGVEPFAAIAARARAEIVDLLFPAEHAALTAAAVRAAGARGRRELGPLRLGRALRALLAGFDVYRTYVTPAGAGAADRAAVERAARRARAATRGELDDALDLLEYLLCQPGGADGQALVRRFQQLSGPVAAKAVEDTAFYRDARFILANEVGGEPGVRPLSLRAFHARSRRRLARHPRTLVATTTHDTKRGEDVRARLALLTECPAAWAARVRAWRRMNGPHRRRGVPDAITEYFLYQTLFGAWPPTLRRDDAAALAELRERIAANARKAAREARLRTSWTAPDAGYEEDLAAFVDAILDPQRSPAFLADLEDFCLRLAPAGALNALVQVVWKVAGPGVPDFYRGAGGWELSLVDPDNRRPGDPFRMGVGVASPDRPGGVFLSSWADGRIKQWVTARALSARAADPELFLRGTWGALAVRGRRRRHCVAWQRRLRGRTAVMVTARFPLGFGVPLEVPHVPPEAWEGTSLAVPAGSGGAVDVFTGRRIALDGRERPLAELLAALPVALFVGGGA